MTRDEALASVMRRFLRHENHAFASAYIRSRNGVQRVVTLDGSVYVEAEELDAVQGEIADGS